MATDKAKLRGELHAYLQRRIDISKDRYRRLASDLATEAANIQRNADEDRIYRSGESLSGTALELTRQAERIEIMADMLAVSKAYTEPKS